MYTFPPIVLYLLLCSIFVCLIFLIRECFRSQKESISIYTINDKNESQNTSVSNIGKKSERPICQTAETSEVSNCYDAHVDNLKESDIHLIKQKNNVSIYVILDTRRK